MGEEIAAEPARRYLRPGESWRPRTWKHFRFSLLRHLQDNGAHTLAELVASPPKVLFLPLSRSEILAALDSARRRGEVVRLHSSEEARISPDDEWVVSEDGRRAIRHGLPWMFRSLPNSLAALAALLGSVGLGKALVVWLNETDGATVAVVAELFIGVVLILGMLLATVRSRAVGVSARNTVSHDWKRWAGARPEWHSIATEPFPWLALAVMLGVFLAGILFIYSQPELRNLGTHSEVIGGVHVERRVDNPALYFLPQAFVLVPLFFTGKPVWAWFQRWNTIAERAADAGK